MNIAWQLLMSNSPTPQPLRTDLDLEKVNPGIGGAVVFTCLAIALVILLFSMNRHIKRVNFEVPEDK